MLWVIVIILGRSVSGKWKVPFYFPFSRCEDNQPGLQCLFSDADIPGSVSASLQRKALHPLSDRTDFRYPEE